MSPNSHSPSLSPFSAIAEAQWLCANTLAFAIYDSFPVSPGHVLVITRRVVPTFFECTLAEQTSLMELVNSAKTLLDASLDPKPDGYNVGFNAGAAAGQTVPHVHVHLIPRYAGDMPDPRGGVRHVIPENGNYLSPAGSQGEPKLSLATGHPHAPLWKNLADRLPGATEIDLLASFVQSSGLDIVQKALFAALAAGARVRLLVGDYLCITAPEALRRLLGWIEIAGPSFEARLVVMKNLSSRPESFHPKAWRITDSSGGLVVVGSSNLSRAALETGVEWNVIGETSGNHPIDRQLAAAFADLWRQATPLSAEVVEDYAARAEQALEWRRVWDGVPSRPMVTEAGPSDPVPASPVPVFQPRPWQAAALASLTAIRREGYAKALVAVATGLGKTWLAAFDAVAHGKSLGRAPRVLVIAHRAEILAQAEVTLRQALDPVSVSWCAGASSDLSGQLVIASIQKLSSSSGLALLDQASPFDYCVVDEVHHAEAPSYRRVLARLKSLFTLGLTATPERTDGVDVATLFDDILAYQATIGDGIAEGSLVPFRYRGLKDDIDFAQIPWRNGRFDPIALEGALENSDRMERLWAEWRARPAGRTLVFCCSRRHALFTRDWLRRRGVRANAVFSESPGPASDSRFGSLSGFLSGELEALCVVDLFNEGLDVPLVDRVVMLRPTESKILFLQQLGRGLRAAPSKTGLDVIDFVGNHRVFASRLMHLLSLAPPAQTAANATTFAVLKSYLAGAEPLLPAGCVLDVDMEAKQLLEQFLPTGRAAVIEAYRGLRAELDRRPTPTEVLHAGYLPLTVSAEYGSWFEFCQSEGDLAADERNAIATPMCLAWVKMLQTTNLTKSYKMVVLRVLLDRDALLDGMEIADLAAACHAFLENHPALRADVEGAAFARVPGDLAAEAVTFAKWWLEWPLSRWMDEQSGRRWFSRRGDFFHAAFDCPAELRTAFQTLTAELVDYRLAHYTRSRLRLEPALDASDGSAPVVFFSAKVSHANGKPILFLPSVEAEPARPVGPTRIRLTDGAEWVFRFVKVAGNIAHPVEATDNKNQLSDLLRQWFGPDAGLPGTGFEVDFTSDGATWSASPRPIPGRNFLDASAVPPATLPRGTDTAPPLTLIDNPPPASRYATHVPVYDLTAAAGFWGPECVPEAIGWTEAPGAKLKPGYFVARVVGKSMEPLIPDGSWCLFRPCAAGSREGRILLVQFNTLGAGENGGRFTVKKYHSDKTVTDDGWRHSSVQLLPVNPAFEPITLEPEDVSDLTIIGELVAQLTMPN